MESIEQPQKGARKQQAIELRLAGLSTSQIAGAMGLKSTGCLSRWLKGVAAPDWTCRPTAKDGVREEATGLRLEGMSYREIQRRLGESKSTTTAAAASFAYAAAPS